MTVIVSNYEIVHKYTAKIISIYTTLEEYYFHVYVFSM